MLNPNNQQNLLEQIGEIDDNVRKFLEYSPIPVAIYDKKGAFLFVNSSMSDLLGFSKPDLLQMSIFDIIKSENAENLLYQISMLQKDEKIINYETIFISKIKQNLNVILDTVCVSDNKFLTFSKNITERKLYEEELKKSKERAEESDRMKTSFLASMSHEIRTPMNAIVGFAQLLSENVPEDSKKQYVKIINKNTNALMNLINDIVTISKIETEQLKINKEEFYINDIINELVGNFDNEKSEQEKPDLNLIVFTKFDTEGSKIFSDKTKLKDILQNLMNYAFKVSLSGNIELGYNNKDANTLLFYMRDNGLQLSSDLHNLLFENYSLLESSQTKDLGSIGLGLSIAKGLVKLIGGSLWYESDKKNGNNFYFTIPYEHTANQVKREPTMDNSEELVKEQFDWKEKLVLIVEDDYSSLKYFEELLKRTNVQRLYATSGFQAIEICRENKNIDLILMDMQLPEINGYEATAKIKQFRKTTPIIAQTAYATLEDKDKCLAAGCDDYVSKPVSRKTLIAKMQKFLS